MKQRGRKGRLASRASRALIKPRRMYMYMPLSLQPAAVLQPHARQGRLPLRQPLIGVQRSAQARFWLLRYP